MKHLDRQLLQVFAQVLYRHAEIVSGAYKLPSRLTRGKTDDDRLADSLATMNRQIHRLNECVNAAEDERDE